MQLPNIGTRLLVTEYEVIRTPYFLVLLRNKNITKYSVLTLSSTTSLLWRKEKESSAH